jgi:hypothetical protein
MKHKPAPTPMTQRFLALNGQVDWYTPKPYLDAARRVMGGIDLDPASSDCAQSHVRAAHHFTPDNDGLEQPWFGRVFCNPPYRQPLIWQFTAKMVQSWLGGDIKAGILLTNTAGDTAWFQLAMRECCAFCIVRGRISFLEVHNGTLTTKAAPCMGSVFFYFGTDGAHFDLVFSAFGTVIHRQRMQPVR